MSNLAEEFEKPPAHFGHKPALDGLRAVAVLSVMAYHFGGVDGLKGGFLGVDMFFVLSGYLITSLLIVEWGNKTTIQLAAFWGRRARRLLPALLVVLLAVAIPFGLYFMVLTGTLLIQASRTLIYFVMLLLCATLGH